MPSSATLGTVRQLRLEEEFGGYRIEAIIARGGMGLVYRARQRRPDRVVALKVIVPELAADPEFRARFEQESSAAAQIEHPNVIPVYEVGEEDGLLYLSMRFVQGIDLGGLLLQNGRLSPEVAAHLTSQVADALDAAHARGLVHRDVKPGNILLAAHHHVYLTDFGLTKRTADTHGMTATGTFVGSVDYVAPEQITGQHVDARADIYSLGCVLYEMLSGSVPFPRDSDVAKIFAHVSDPPPWLDNVPARLAEVVARAMAKRPEERFQTVAELGSAVLAAAGAPEFDAGQPTSTGGPSPADASTETRLAQRPPPEGLESAATSLRSSEEPQVTVVVVDDHPFFRDGVSHALGRNAQIAVIAEAADGREGLELIRRELPTVALVDYQMPEMDGIALLHEVVHEQLATRVLLLSAVIDSATVFRAVEEGAAGYLSKDASRQEIVDGVLSAARGDTVVPGELAGALATEIRLRADSRR
jgi:serine/threonine protein kinase